MHTRSSSRSKSIAGRDPKNEATEPIPQSSVKLRLLWKQTLLIYGATSFTCFCIWVAYAKCHMSFEILWDWHKFSWWDAIHQHPSECLLIPTVYTGKRPRGSGTMYLKTSRGQSMWVTGKVTSSTAKLSRTPSEARVDPTCMVRFVTNNELYP